jgi:hypothetical protein
MKALYFMVFTFICLNSLTGKAQDTLRPWEDSYRSAFTMPQGRLEMALFHQWRYGIGENLELASNPVIFIPDPNLKLKIQWRRINDLQFASEHGFTIPTLLMRISQIQGAGGIIPRQYDIPLLITINNAVRVSKPLMSRSLLSAKAGILFSIRGKVPDPGSSVDLPILYPRMAVYYHQPVLDFELNYQWNLSRTFKAFIGNELFLVNRKNENLFFEHCGNITWMKKRTGVQAGYKLCYGEYPFGTQWHLLPSLDLLIRNKK